MTQPQSQSKSSSAAIFHGDIQNQLSLSKNAACAQHKMRETTKNALRFHRFKILDGAQTLTGKHGNL
jgi:hypothetical protein